VTKERTAKSWQEFHTAAPELAAAMREQFERYGVALVGTLRKDGSPRISCVEPCIVDGVLYLGMMWKSRKAADLLRDPRLVLHNPICTNRGDELELKISGRAREVDDPEVRRACADAVERTSWNESPFHLFAVDIESVAMVKYERGRQRVKVWPKGTEFERPYG
jgi:Pyridoxamine 5'-phosphate oxidase